MSITKIWEFLKYYIKPYTKKTILCLLIMLIFIPMSVIYPWINKIIIDDTLMVGNYNKLINIIILLLFLKIVESLLGYYVQYQFNMLNLFFIKDIRNKIFESMLKIKIHKILEYGKGNIISRLISDVQIISGTFSVVFFAFFFQGITIIVLSIILITINYKLAAAVYFFIPIYIYIIKKLNPKIIKLSKEERNKFDHISMALQEAVNGIKEIKSLGISYNIERLFNEHLINHLKASRSKIIITYFAINFSNFISGLPYIIILFGGSILVFEKNLTIGELLAYLQYSSMLFNPIKQLVEQNFNFQNAIPSIERISELKEKGSHEDYKYKNKIHQNIDDIFSIKFNNVSFAFNVDYPVLKNINFTVEKGQPVAIVGKSGAGKSTIVQLLLNWIDRDAGEILLNNKNINSFDKKELKKEIGVVHQESFWFNTSIKNNFTIVKEDITSEEILNLLEKVNALGFVLEKENKLDYIVGDNASNLSIGEKQRLSIARALIYNPKILIFDEVTSSVDGISERYIMDLIEKIKDGKIILFISHRISSIKDFKKVIFLKNGEIDSIDSHEKLIEENIYYQRNFNSTKI